MKRTYLTLFIIILVGIALRLYGINFGLPFLLHNDESIIVNYALSYGKGDLNPHFFYLPPLLSYVLFFFYGVFYVGGLLAGVFHNVGEFGTLFLNDPTVFYLIGRVLFGLIPGVISIYLIYSLAKRCFSRLTGLLSAFFLSVNFLHVRDSHYVYGDIPLTMVILMYFIVLYDMFKSEKARSYVYAGLLLGVGISIKYNAAFLAVPTLLVMLTNLIFYRRHSFLEFIKKGLILTGASFLAFFITNPFMFLEMETVLHEFRHALMMNLGVWFHLNISILGSMGILMLIASGVGMAVALLRRKVFPAILIVYAFLYYLILTRSSQPNPRYIFPILPVLLMFAAYFVDVVVSRFRKGSWKVAVGTGLVIVLVFYSCLKVYYVDKLFAEEDTRALAYQWVVDNIPAGSVIALDSTGPAYPSLRKTKQQIKENLQTYTARKFPKPEGALEYKIKLLLENPEEDENAYRLYYIKPKVGRKVFFGAYPEVPADLESIKASGIEYVIVSPMLERLDKYGELLIDLEENGTLVEEITPYKSGDVLLKYKTIREPAAVFELRELRDRERYGPSFKIYRIKKKR